MLHPIGKQVYKLELFKKWKIHNVVYLSLLEYNIMKKGRVSDMQLKFEAGNDKEYKVVGIWDSTIYARKLAGQLPRLYYLVS